MEDAIETARDRRGQRRMCYFHCPPIMVCSLPALSLPLGSPLHPDCRESHVRSRPGGANVAKSRNSDAARHQAVVRFTERRGDAARMAREAASGGVAADLRGGLRRGRHDPGGRRGAGGGGSRVGDGCPSLGLGARRGVATISLAVRLGVPLR